MADKEFELAVQAVANGTATDRQQERVRKEAKQAGLKGSEARDAFEGKTWKK